MITANERLEILALYAEYNRSIDAGDSSAWACTFIQEGVFHHPAQDFAGREQLESFVKERTSKMAMHSCIEQRHWNDAISLEGAAGAIRANPRCWCAAGMSTTSLKLTQAGDFDAAPCESTDTITANAVPIRQ